MRPFSATKSRLLLLLILLVAVVAGTNIYKWVDEKGQVHFGDNPPANLQVDELKLPKDPPNKQVKTSQEKLQKLLQSVNSTIKAQQDNQQQAWNKKYENDLMKDQNFKLCTQAKYQVASLEQQVRVFRLERDWTRIYLDDTNRPHEISRLKELVDQHCDSDSESISKQSKRILEISSALSIRCVTSRESLHKSKVQETDIDMQAMKRAQNYIKLNCPDIELHKLWIVDWIFVRKS